MSVEEVFKAAPGCQKVLMAALEACRTPRTPSELDSIIGRGAPVQPFGLSSGGVCVALLVALRRAGIRTQRGRASGASCP